MNLEIIVGKDSISSNINSILKEIEGVNSFDVNDNKLVINFDNKKLSLEELWSKIKTNIDFVTKSDLMKFNKNMSNVREDVIVLKSVCCEFCVKGMIEELMLDDDINSCEGKYTSNDIHGEVKLYITCKEETSPEKIRRIEKKFNEN